MSTLRTVETEHDRTRLYRWLATRPLPFVITHKEGVKRSDRQNRLNRQWMHDIAKQLGWEVEYARGYCKLHFGVPILRNDDEVFAAEYDEVIKPLPYEHKIKLMMVPFDFGVTRLMTVKQETQYLDAVHRHFAEQGVALTDPEQLRMAA